MAKDWGTNASDQAKRGGRCEKIDRWAEQRMHHHYPAMGESLLHPHSQFMAKKVSFYGFCIKMADVLIARLSLINREPLVR